MLITALQPIERYSLTDAVRSISWSPTERTLALGADGRARLGDHEQLTAPIGPDPVGACWITGERVAVIDAALGVVVAGGGSIDAAPVLGPVCVEAPRVDADPNVARHQYAVVAGHDGVSVIRPEPVGARQPTRISTGPVRALTHLGGSIWLAGGAGGLVVVDVALAAVDQRVELPGVVAMAAAPAIGRIVAADATGALHVLDLGDLERGTELTGYPDAVRLLDISPSGEVVVACADDEVTWWAVDRIGRVSDEPECSVGHESPITACAFGSSGYVATGDPDGVVRLWSPRLRDLPLAALHVGDEVTELRWSPWGERLAIGTAGGDVVVATVDAGDVL
ncbi:MAG: WD40 repeat domain-containing protein [Actinomycetota bacterium]